MWAQVLRRLPPGNLHSSSSATVQAVRPCPSKDPPSSGPTHRRHVQAAVDLQGCAVGGHALGQSLQEVVHPHAAKHLVWEREAGEGGRGG